MSWSRARPDFTSGSGNRRTRYEPRQSSTGTRPIVARFRLCWSQCPGRPRRRGGGPDLTLDAVGDVDERVRQAGLLYERAVFTGDAAPLAQDARELDGAEADLAVARAG